MSRLLVASIDIGTTYSGWAFSFRNEYKSDPKKVFTKHWRAAPLVSTKAPTCVLIRKTGETVELDSFGYAAEDAFHEKALDSEKDEWYFFKRFKMMLYNRKDHLTRHTKIKDINGKELEAITVFSLCIRYLRDDVMKTVNDRYTGGELTEKDIRWVLTVPAIWDDPAKQFMREAAAMADIERQHLLIALKPESASLFCHHLPVEKGKQGVLSTFAAGTKYLVLDAGGGTVDITVHQVTEHGGLKELQRASGGAWGGTKVDAAYEEFLEEITGKRGVIERFKKEHMEDFVELFRYFELKKGEISVCHKDKTSTIKFRIPLTLAELSRTVTGSDLKTNIANSNYKGKISINKDKLLVDNEVAVSFFEKPIKSILTHVESLLQKPHVHGCKTIVMVGGFSDSNVLQEQMKSKFPSVKIIIPNDAGMAVLKGAVIFGHNPKAISQRILKYTYGEESTHEFKEACLEDHPTGDRERDENGVMRCFNIFDIHACAGQAVMIDQEQPEQVYTPLYDEQTEVSSPILITNDEKPKFVDDKCTEIGKWSMPIRDTSKGRQREFGVSFLFGGTEVEVKVTDKTSGSVKIIPLECLD